MKRTAEEFTHEAWERGKTRRAALLRRRRWVLAAAAPMACAVICIAVWPQWRNQADKLSPTENTALSAGESAGSQSQNRVPENAQLSDSDGDAAFASDFADGSNATTNTTKKMSGAGNTNSSGAYPGSAGSTGSTGKSENTTATAQTTGATVHHQLIASFAATVLELRGDYVLVRPDAGTDAAASADRISFSRAGLEDIGVTVGDRVIVYYDGRIMESYPARVKASAWRAAE